MVTSTSCLQFALSFFFFANKIFIYYGCSQIFELFHFFKVFITPLYFMIFPALWSRDMIIYLVFSTFASRPITLLATTKASVFMVSLANVTISRLKLRRQRQQEITELSTVHMSFLCIAFTYGSDTLVP